MPIPQTSEITLTTDGETTTSMTIVGYNGTPGSPIVIDCEWLDIDGQGLRVPLLIDGCSYLTIQNLTLHDSDATVCQIQNSDNIIVERSLAYNAGTGNFNAFGVHSSTNCTIRDCAAWGEARKLFSGSQGGNDLTWERCWGRWDSYTGEYSNKMTFTPAYNNYRNTFRHCLGTVNELAGSVNGVFFADHMDDPALPSADTTLVECLAYSLLKNRVGFSSSVCEGLTFTDCVDGTSKYRDRGNLSVLWRIRDAWKSSPILSRVITLAGVDILADIDVVIAYARRDLLERLGQQSRQSTLLSGNSYPMGKPTLWLDAGHKAGVGTVDDETAEARSAELSTGDAMEDAAGVGFDGALDHADIAAGSEVTTNAGGGGASWTFIAKVRVDGVLQGQGDLFPNASAIIGESDDTAADGGMSAFIGISKDGFPIIFGGGASAQHSAAGSHAGDGKIHTIVGCYNATYPRIELSVDGVFIKGVACAEHVAAPSCTTIGARKTSSGFSRHFHGIVYECGRFPGKLSAEAIAAYHSGTWPSDTCSGRWVLSPEYAADGDRVGVWRSRRGRAGLMQAAVATRPTLDASAFGDDPGVEFSGHYLKAAYPTVGGESGYCAAVVRVRGGSRLFDGVDQRFSLAENPAYGSNSFTIEAFCYPVSLGGYVLGFSGTSAAYAGASIFAGSGPRYTFTTSDGASAVAKNVYTAPVYEWSHVVGVCDRVAQTIQLWVNGVASTTSSIAAYGTNSLTPPTSHGKCIGGIRFNSPTYTLAGRIAYARVALGAAYTEAEVLESYNGGVGVPYHSLSAALKAKITSAWDLAESSGGISDLVGTNHGNQTGTDSAIAAASAPPAGQQVIYSQSDESSNVRHLALGIDGRNRAMYRFNDNGTEDLLNGDTEMPPGVHLVEWISDGDTVAVYVDGVSQTVAAVTGSNGGKWFGDAASLDNSIVAAMQNSDGVSSRFYGGIAEVLAYDSGQLSRAPEIRDRLLTKYGLN